ncbi:MAG: hypothetical protein NC079_02895 [Clostridium sp.]|nr:hypothetical protein [Acetatifactor muris]MCM1525923.1 hypothetical protein [Bacteroides sp.]MCM1562538.1 hypothetical protein [Clostridium sp.]
MYRSAEPDGQDEIRETEIWEEEYTGEEYEDIEYADGEYADGEYESVEYTDGEYDDQEYEDVEYYEDEEYYEDRDDVTDTGAGDYEDGEYVAEEYADGEYVGTDYADGDYEDGEYVNGEYAEGEYGGVEYADAEYSEEEYAEEYEDAYYEDSYSEEYVEEEYYEDEPYDAGGYADADSRPKSRPGIVTWFTDMSGMDRAMLIAGICVICLVVAAGVFVLRSNKTPGWISELATVGTDLEGIEVIGDEGLLAVADATIAKQEALRILEQEQRRQQEEDKNYNEADYNKNVTVSLKMVSVQKDLKIKFVNKSSDKLISNVPFIVTVTTPDNKTETWSDDDMDGIIYKKNIAPGNYKVSVNALSNEKYAGYTLPETAQTVEVKKDIAYKKIDVADEVKTESQVNLATEEQKKVTPVVESALTDTVEWVESTAVPNTYIEVNRNSITDPLMLTAVKQGSFMRMSEITDNPAADPATGAVPGAEPTPVPSAEPVPQPTVEQPPAGTVSVNVPSVTLTVGASGTAQIVPAGFAEGRALTYGVYSVNANVAQASVDGAGTVSIVGVGEGETDLVANVNYQDVPVSDPPVVEIHVTVTASGAIGLDRTELTVRAGLSENMNVTLNGMTNATVTAVSSDGETVSAAVNGQVVTVTGIREGTATVTVYAANGIGTLSATCAVTVKAHPKDDSSSRLKDNSGNQLYVQENGEYREAVYADYYKEGMTFFRKGDVRYTGWQTLDGRVYFFDGAGNKVTGEQVIQGAKYNFGSDGALVTGDGIMGIDVSKHNGTIDWNAVKNSGVSYVIIRCGYRGYTQGSLIIDPKFEQNIKGANSAGLKVGVYFFSQAVDEVEAVEEASFVLDCVRNYQISYPIFLDVEYSGAAGNKGRADGLGSAGRTSVCKAFCETIRSGGYTAGIYANKTWLETKLDPGQLGSYKIWLAQYAASPTYTGRYDLWQYKSTGKVSGISGSVDMNLSYLGY